MNSITLLIILLLLPSFTMAVREDPDLSTVVYMRDFSQKVRAESFPSCSEEQKCCAFGIRAHCQIFTLNCKQNGTYVSDMDIQCLGSGVRSKAKIFWSPEKWNVQVACETTPGLSEVVLTKGTLYCHNPLLFPYQYDYSDDGFYFWDGD